MPTAEDFAHSRLISYAAYQWPGYRDAAHHRLIARALEAVERGEITRLMINMPPRHGKSMLASEFFPAWYMGRNPHHYVVTATYAQDLADDFGRKVKNQIQDPVYQEVFPGVTLADDSKSAKRFNISSDIVGTEVHTAQKGAFFAVGVGGPLTGRGAHLLLIDDPVKNREDAESEVIRRKIKEWYTSTAYTRLMPGGRVVIIQCMTGDTPVLLPDGSERALREIRKGDLVATYKDGRLASAKVLNWSSQGVDRIFTIKTKSGITVRANERHPFLVDRGGVKVWVRLKELATGDLVVRAIGGSGAMSSVATKGVTSPLSAKACATHTTTKSDGRTVLGRHQSIQNQDAPRTSSTGMAYRLSSMTQCLLSKAVNAPFVTSLRERMCNLIGVVSCALTTATTQARSAASCAMTAISQLGTVGPSKPCLQPLDTYVIDLDEIVSITPSGVEEVFDIQVEGTENFIANGLVSHNTRWHEDDLSGWLLREHRHEGWHVLNLPAISPDGEALWPEQYDLGTLEKIKLAVGQRDWSALYQQAPSPETGDYFKREWVVPVDVIPPKEELRIFGASDYAVTSNGGDYTVHVVVGVSKEGRMYLLDMWRQQASSDRWVDALCALVGKWGPIGWAEETGQIKSGVGPFLMKRMIETGNFVVREQFPTRGDKAVRAQSIRGRMAMQGLHVPRDAPWVTDLISEMMSFPVGVHDDQVDALGLAGQLMDKLDLTSKPKLLQEGVQPGHYGTHIVAPEIRIPKRRRL